MKTLIPRLRNTTITILLCLICSVTFLNLKAQSFDITGTYTIDPAGGAFDPGLNDNFLTFSQAVDTLVSRGIGGAVTINVVDGNYDESFVIGAIPGSGPANTVLFQSASLDSTKVYLTYSGFSSTSKTLLTLDGASYITFKLLSFDATGGNTSYGQAVWLTGSSHHIYFENNSFIGKSSGYSSYNDDRSLISSYQLGVEYLEFRNNRFTYGENGIYISGSSTLLAAGIIVENNLFYEQNETSLALRYLDSPVVKNNIIDIASFTGKTGISIEYVDKGFEISANKISLNSSYAGIYVKDSDGNPGNEGLIANNFIANSNSGTSYNYGFWVRNSTFIKFYNNSVSLTGTWLVSSRAFHQESGGNNLDIRNNNFYNNTGGYAYYITTATAVGTSNNNNYYTTGNFLARWGTTDLAGLSNLVSSSGDDAASISVNPWFLDNEDLHTTNYRLESMGADLTTDLAFDIDGEARTTSPDIGADEFTGIGSPLSGTYTVGGASPDFTSLSDAVASLNEMGVSGAVTFNIRDDDSPYIDPITIEPVSGASATDTVTFQADPANTSDVIISHDASGGFTQTVHLRRANNIIFRNLTLAASNSTNSIVLRLNGYCKDILLVNCDFSSIGTSYNNASIYSEDDLISNLTVSGNNFNGGYRGVHIDGLSASLSVKPAGISISNNTFSDHYASGVYLRDCVAPLISDNEFSSSPSSYNYWGIHLEYCDNNYQILRNKVRYSVDDGGIYLYYCSGSSTYVGKVINNYLDMVSGSNSVTGIYTYYTSYCDIYFNTSKINAGNTNTYSVAYSNYNGSNIRVKNNNFINFGPGKAYYNSSLTSITESDYNNLFTTGTYIAQWGANNYAGIDDLSAASAKDLNSQNINPWFVAEQEPEVNSSFLDGTGVAISGINTDINGNPRSDPPDIGAAEYTASQLPLDPGVYTIGGSSPDYTTVTAALSDLQLRGISGPVTLSIRSGDYDEHIGTVLKIPGASATDTVVLKSETGNPEDVRIFKLTDNTGGPFNVISLKGVEYFTIRDVTISALGTSYGRPLNVEGVYKNVNIINNILTSANTNTNCVNLTGISEDILIKDNIVSNGYVGIYFWGDVSIYGSGIVISGNSISGSRYYGLYIKYLYAPEIIGNTIRNSASSGFEGIRAEYCTDRYIISGNRIINDQSYYGIYLYYCSSTLPFYGLISNNMITVGGTYTAYGIYLTGCTRSFIYYNSINITSTSSSYGSGIYTYNNNAEIEIVNNVIANNGAGYALSIADLADVTSCNYNNLYSAGTNLVWLNSTNYTDLASWRAASSLDLNSISVNPLYYSDQDLHSKQPGLHQKATPLAMVTTDFDGLARDATKPDIGAAEFSCVSPEFNVVIDPVCLGDSTLIIDSTLNVAPGSTRGWDMDGDLVPDVYTSEDFETIKWAFDQSGTTMITYIVQQIAGCNDYVNANADIIPEPVLAFETLGAYCDEDDGSAKVTVTNIEGPFSYYWSNGSTDSIANNLPLGSYTVTVTDETGCAASGEVSIGEAIEVTVTQLNPSTCGDNDGSAIVAVSGGVGPYTYVWALNGETTAQNDSLTPGTQYVSVIDADGCVAQGYVDIESNGGPQISLVAIDNNDCYGQMNGSIDLTITGGVSPYEILWTNGETTEDIQSLSSGIYNIVVEDAEGCIGAGSFQISDNPEISISSVITPASCGNADGSAVAIVGGGYKPYSYAWSSGGTFKIEEGLSAGVYSLTVSDGKGCVQVEPIIVNNVDAPVVTITDVQGVGCTITDNGSISVNASPANPFYTYSWSSGQTTPTVTGLSAGTYEITVTDDLGCEGVNQAVVEQVLPEINPICIVTVDTLTGKNLVLWEKLVTDDISHYNVYRETSVKGQYQVIASVDAGSLSEYIDSVADPYIRSWRYKLSAVDLCGNESELSPHHKTMHLTMNVGIDGAVNLIWDHYEGFPLSTYKIWRFNTASGWVNIADVPSNLTSYTDADPPKDDLTYYIEVDSPGSCTSTEKKASTYNSSRSNRRSVKKALIDLTAPIITTCAEDKTQIADESNESTIPDLTSEVVATDDGNIASITQEPTEGTVVGLGVTTVTITVADEAGNESTCTTDVTVQEETGVYPGESVYYKLQIYPNPGTGLYNLDLETATSGEFTLSVYDISGKQISMKEYKQEEGKLDTQIDLSSYPNGIYQLRIKTDNLLLHRILIKK